MSIYKQEEIQFYYISYAYKHKILPRNNNLIKRPTCSV